MVFQLDDNHIGFPDPSLASEEGLLAFGGDLSPMRLLNAYAMGIFPWPVPGHPLLWWSLDPRMVMLPSQFRCSKSLQRTLRSRRFEVRIDTAFEDVIRNCSAVERQGQEGESWITDAMIEAYVVLHRLGFAHSFETYEQGRLVGGLYGVSMGRFFSGESMFHLERDASKVAFARMVDFAALHGFQFIDAQQPTNHLASLGAQPMPRADFLAMLKQQPWDDGLYGQWKNNTVVLLIGGNQGDRMALIDRAVEAIGQRIGQPFLRSRLYRTAPWGFEAEQDFLNQALVVDTDMSPLEVLGEALAIEAVLGRCRNGQETGYQSRPMDIDLIFYNGEVMDTAALVLPHPRMHLRRFVLAPLAEIIPDYFHPKFRKTVRQLLAECPDNSAVEEFISCDN